MLYLNIDYNIYMLLEHFVVVDKQQQIDHLLVMPLIMFIKFKSTLIICIIG